MFNNSEKKQKKPPSNNRQKRFMMFMRDGLTDQEDTMESPMAVYEWFLKEWDRPLNLDGMRQAWLAAWAVSIDDGLVKL